MLQLLCNWAISSPYITVFPLPATKTRVEKFGEKLWVVLMMKKCCCFCGKEIKEFPQYVLTVQKSNQDESTETPLQDLFCHEDCFVKRLFDDKWLYIKYT